MDSRSPHPSSPTTGIRIGISSCLLGNGVRFDGGHKHDHFITGTLGQFFHFVPVCPEVAIGLGVPREPIRLVGDPQRPRAVGVCHPDLDVTDALSGYGARMAAELSGISGYIFKSKSPSCGMERVKVYQDGGGAGRSGVGLYAREVMARQPLLPVEDEGRLGDPVLRENFIERVLAYRRWQELDASGLTAAKLVDFHAAHKLSLMSRGPERLHALGRLVAQVDGADLETLAHDYIRGFMEALKHRAARKRHTNVLMLRNGI